jgi:hypothetical protein
MQALIIRVAITGMAMPAATIGIRVAKAYPYRSAQA